MFDREKFKALVHYVVARAAGKPNFGAVKLNKVLWFADARQYLLTGKPITGAEYVRQQFGPVPRQIVQVRDELVAEGKIKFTPPKFAYEGWRFSTLRPAATALFSSEEIATVNWWINHIADEHTADSISDESHDYAWEIAKTGETLPLFSQLASRIREPQGAELAWAQAVASRLGAA
jgi:hypothetical protein